ncbi:MAG: ABC transporter ATP-binding protein [Thermoleophilia bacterium]|nr:ABC transporter ATP-binding protein [Thermoleophilia bacterium]
MSTEYAAVIASSLSKQYRLGRPAERYRTARESLIGAVKRPVRRAAGVLAGNAGIRVQAPTTWALRDVSFAVPQGEAVGIIGRNGAGKSTLLKILSRITEPTEGYADLFGRVGALLEVGTGFHPELTGRENIFLNGAILGMRKAEIQRQFDAIVDFAEISRFIDTPVKRYSSGMYVRLAFAVAAHLEPEILLVDEVLAVGDIDFQKKCLGKMGEVAHEGRTVLFVSHNMAAIQNLCDTGIVLDGGRLVTMAPVAEAIHHYHELLRETQAGVSTGMAGVRITSVQVPGGYVLTSDSPLEAVMELETDRLLERAYVNCVVEDVEGRYMVHVRTDVQRLYPTFRPGLHRVTVRFPRASLRTGVYTLWFRVFVSSSDVDELVDSERLMLQVEGPQVGGLIDVPCEWSFESGDESDDGIED